jgi:bifunctional non-homologous end joining protein LigD
MLRAAAFKGLRDDKPASEIILEEKPKRSKSPSASAVAKIRLTHPERILWELPGVTKQGLADFYTDIADHILPHVAGRVLSLFRSPLGTRQSGFFAKHPWKGLSDAIRRVDVGESQPMLVVDDLPGLLSLVQADVVEIHPWGSKADHLDHPDRLIFDLDPGEEVPWSAVVEAATDVRRRLEDFGLRSFVKTSGGKGLHVVVPVEPRASWDEAKAFAHAIAQQMTKDRPDRYVATSTKRTRRGRIFVDYLRNGRGATAVAAFSTRALPQASVSTPLAWQELSEDIRSDHFKVDNLRQRLDFLKRDPWQGFFTVRQHW